MNWEEFNYYLWADGDFNFLWIIVIAVLVFFGTQFLKWSKTIDLKTTKRLYFGFGFFFLGYAVCRLFFLFSNYYYEYGMEATLAFQLHTRLAYVSGIFSIGFFLYGLEMNFLNTKGIITLIAAAHGVLTLVLPSYDTLRYITYWTNPVYFVVTMALYFYIAAKSTGSIRRNAFRSIIGLFIFFAGIFLDSRMFKILFTDMGIRWIPFLVPPICLVSGLAYFYIANKLSNRDLN